MKVEATANETELDGDYGTVEGLTVTCARCGHEVEVFGTQDASRARATIMLRKECPRGEANFYDINW